MSKARLIITAVIFEGRSQAEVARTYNVSPGWVSKLIARWRAEGDTALQPRSRRPHTNPRSIDELVARLIVELRHRLVEQGLDAGPDTISWHLKHHHGRHVSTSTIWRTLHRAGLIEPEPKKRPKSSYIRFQAALPNECWQSDVTHWRLPDGSTVQILTFLDDCTRYAIDISCHTTVTTPTVTSRFRTAIATHGTPASTLTDNGMIFTTRLAGRGGGRNGFEALLRHLHVVQKNSRPGHPTTCGKVERFQQTMKNWLRALPAQPRTLTELQKRLDEFATTYNQHRPHRSLPHRATPHARYTALPKATPTTDRTGDFHARLRHDIVDKAGCITLRHAGRLHHIGISRIHTAEPVIILADDLNIRIIHATTGELLRELTLDPTRNYQPTGRPKGPQKRQKPPNP